MSFKSILFISDEYSVNDETIEEPNFFVDLNLDQIINSITDSKRDYDLKPFFYTPLRDLQTIQYRHEIMQDIENEELYKCLQSFANKMIVANRYLALMVQLDFKYHREGWFLEAVELYCDTVSCLEKDLCQIKLSSRGLLAFRDYLSNYVNSNAFLSLQVEAKKLKTELATVKYCVNIKNLTVKVRKYENEIDYSVDVIETFEKFKQGAVKDYRVKLYQGSGMNHIEAQILNYVAKLYPEIFAGLDRFYLEHSNFMEETIRVFDREIQFYIAYLEYIGKIKPTGLKFCYPYVSNDSKEVCNEEGFDLALANKRISENSFVVCNNFFLEGQERIFIVSGPNQGGKTTFARTFGQLHYLASLGCPVPGTKAKLFLFDNIYTHFEKEENIKNLRGKLQDDLVRISEILAQATPESIVIMNEIFTSTSLKDAVFLGKKILGKINQLDMLCVFVTFLDELATLSEKTVSMVSTVDHKNPTLRTFKIIRKPADGLAYAISIAEKYRLTFDDIKDRIQP